MDQLLQPSKWSCSTGMDALVFICRMLARPVLLAFMPSARCESGERESSTIAGRSWPIVDLESREGLSKDPIWTKIRECRAVLSLLHLHFMNTYQGKPLRITVVVNNVAYLVSFIKEIQFSSVSSLLYIGSLLVFFPIKHSDDGLAAFWIHNSDTMSPAWSTQLILWQARNAFELDQRTLWEQGARRILPGDFIPSNPYGANNRGRIFCRRTSFQRQNIDSFFLHQSAEWSDKREHTFLSSVLFEITTKDII